MEIINGIRYKLLNNGQVTQLDHVKLPTKMLKIALGIYLLQNGGTIAYWSIKDGVLYPWLIFFYSFLQVGWIWNKAVEYWKSASQDPSQDPSQQIQESIIDIYGSDSDTDSSSSSEELSASNLSAPDINVEISGIIPVQGQLAQIIEHPLQPSNETS